MASASDLARVSKAQVLYLTTTGRKTSLPRTIEIWFAASGEMVYIMSGAGPKSNWVQNLLLNPAVSLKYRTQDLSGEGAPPGEAARPPGMGPGAAPVPGEI